MDWQELILYREMCQQMYLANYADIRVSTEWQALMLEAEDELAEWERHYHEFHYPKEY